MTNKIKEMIFGGVGGSIGFAIVGAVITAAITGTTAADTLFTSVVPISIAGGVATIIIIAVFG